MASASASLLIGFSGALLLYSHAGWTVTLLALAAVYLIPLAVLTRIPEPPEPDGPDAAAPGPGCSTRCSGTAGPPRGHCW
ncbi:hypothetical protein E1281_32900 [Actinomadura sp. KC345]|uniref:hypothetical protein n=1 Tax=Actinomadura sp. KC345 TaxID=2530371 RepID=UPI001053E2A8|nr:hypothetical protein [Actinomadura sp. KC345]TDC44718.1 hypothetical protein E1281_32900 [Actinomadura sp. KC345]